MWRISARREYDTVINKSEENSRIATAEKDISTLTYNTHYACHCRDLKRSKATGKYIL